MTCICTIKTGLCTIKTWGAHVSVLLVLKTQSAETPKRETEINFPEMKDLQHHREP